MQLSASSRPPTTTQPAHTFGRRTLVVTAAVGRRRPLIRRRGSLSARQRKRRKYRDEPRRLQGVDPGAPGFEGRLMTEISGANGPRQLHALVLQFGPSLSQRHLAAALSRLAGYATKPPPRAARPPAAHARTRRHSVSGAGKSPGSALDDEDEEGGDEEADGGDDGGGGGGGGASGDGLYGGSQMSDGELFPLLEASARRCASVLLLRSGQGRLEPMPTATAVYALGRVRVHNRALCEAVIAHTFDRLGELPPDGLAALLGGLGELRHRPHDEWLTRFSVESFSRMARFNGPELANMSHALCVLECPPSQQWLHSAMRAFRASFGTSATAPATAKMLFALAKLQARPQFNWMTAVLADARRQIDRFTARELAVLLWSAVAMGHPPDAVFMEVWFVACARRMASLTPPAALLCLSALAATSDRGTRPSPERFSRLLLPHLQGLLPSLDAEQLCDVLRCVVAMRIRPYTEWMVGYETALGARLPDLRDSEHLGGLAWALGRLRYQPGPAAARLLRESAERLLPSARAHDAGLMVWGMKQVELDVPAVWGDALVNKVREEGLQLKV